MITEAIILAGGLGTRLQPAIGDIPKPMALISGKPFLEILINNLRLKGIKHIILSLGYKSEVIIDFVKREIHNIRISFSVEPFKMGTGGAIRLAIEKVNTNYVLVTNGDSFIDFNIQTANDYIDKYQASVIYGCYSNDTSQYGSIEYINNLITRFIEKKTSHEGIISAGIYVLPKKIFKDIPKLKPFSIENDFFSTIGPNNNFRIIISKDTLIDIGTPDLLEKAKIEIRNNYSELLM